MPTPERSPEATRVALAVRATTRIEDISRAEILDRIERLTGARPSYQWIQRHLGGYVHLTELRPSTVPNDDLILIARAVAGDDPASGGPSKVALALAGRWAAQAADTTENPDN